jgi:beta-galactosidase
LLETSIFDAKGAIVITTESTVSSKSYGKLTCDQDLIIKSPNLWSVDRPYLYKVLSQLIVAGKMLDSYTTTLGIRYFNFDPDKGFSLNGKYMKILGVCDQLQLLKSTGCNAIRTSHNPPAPELLDLCDKMGFIVMDEAFDCW